MNSDAKRNTVTETEFGIETEECQEGLSGRLEAETFSGRKIMHQYDVLEVGLGELIDGALSWQVTV